MAMHWSDFALESLAEILCYYETEASPAIAADIENRIFEQVDAIATFPMRIPESDIYPGTRKLVILRLPYVAFIRQRVDGEWQVVDIVHTSRKIPKES